MALESKQNIKSYETVEKAFLVVLKESLISFDNRTNMTECIVHKYEIDWESIKVLLGIYKQKYS